MGLLQRSCAGTDRGEGPEVEQRRLDRLARRCFDGRRRLRALVGAAAADNYFGARCCEVMRRPVPQPDVPASDKHRLAGKIRHVLERESPWRALVHRRRHALQLHPAGLLHRVKESKESRLLEQAAEQRAEEDGDQQHDERGGLGEAAHREGEVLTAQERALRCAAGLRQASVCGQPSQVVSGRLDLRKYLQRLRISIRSPSKVASEKTRANARTAGDGGRAGGRRGSKL